jgi:hypothetical protein
MRTKRTKIFTAERQRAQRMQRDAITGASSARTVSKAAKAKSSVRSAMCIAVRSPRVPAKLRRSGMEWSGLAFCCRCPWISHMPLLRSLAVTHGGGFYKHGAPDGAWFVRLGLISPSSMPWLRLRGRAISLTPRLRSRESALSLTPWLQPGENRAQPKVNRFNGLPPLAQAVETAVIVPAVRLHRAEAACHANGLNCDCPKSRRDDLFIDAQPPYAFFFLFFSGAVATDSIAASGPDAVPAAGLASSFAPLQNKKKHQVAARSINRSSLRDYNTRSSESKACKDREKLSVMLGAEAAVLMRAELRTPFEIWS